MFAGAEIPADLWASARAEMQEVQKRQSKKGKARGRGLLLAQFTYSLKDRKFFRYGAGRASNLFLEHAMATEEGDYLSMTYMTVQMDDEDVGDFSQEGQKESASFGYDVDPLRETILRQGIRIVSDPAASAIARYHLIGCSNSQVSKHCYYFRRASNLQENETRLLRVLPSLCQLEQKKGTPKRVKYAGLLFSGINAVTLPRPVVVEEVQSFKHNNFDFTDGPGLISRKLALWVSQQLGISKSNCPSVFQIRYCGEIKLLEGPDTKGFVCKGVLVVDPTNDDSFRIQVRQSMLKIEASSAACRVLQGILGICGSSRPTPGRLGQQQVCLLSGTVERSDLLKMQGDHLDCVQNSLRDPFAMAWVIALDKWSDNWKNFHKLIVADGTRKWDGQVPPTYLKCARKLERNNTALTKKVQLPLAASRTLFGAVFLELLHDKLNEGECVVLLEDGLFRPNNGDSENYVIVSRSPSYHPGDIRALRAVSLPTGHPVRQLRNCILFSTKGERPDPDKMGGGDLDGDMYLVIWHPTLLKYSAALRAIKPADYDAPAPSSGTPEKTDWIHYVAMMDNSMLGEVESTFYKLAKKDGAKSVQVEKLNKLFSSLVDRHPTSLDSFQRLKNSTVEDVSQSPCVWEDMAARQGECCEMNRITVRKHLAGNRLESYRLFHEQTMLASMSRTLITKITNVFACHFHECLLRADILKTVSALEQLSPPDQARSAPFRHGDDVASNDRSNVDVARQRKVTKKENATFSRFEKRANDLFKKPIARISEETLPFTNDFEEQTARKQTLYSDYEKEVSLLSVRKQKINDNIDQAKIERKAWLERHRNRMKTLKLEKQEKFKPLLERLKARQHEKESLLEAEKISLNGARQELRGMWYKVGIWSSVKREATERKERIEANIKDLKRHIKDLDGKILQQQHIITMILETLRLDAEKEEKEQCSIFDKYIVKMEDERDSVEKASRDRRLMHERLINGTQKKQLQNELGKLKRSNGTIEDITGLAERLAGMFCPDLLKKATTSIEMLNEKRESLELAKQHIFHEVAMARQIWKGEVEARMALGGHDSEKWKALVENLERVLSIEKNRLLGVPNEGKRSGPMPVYHKRAELQRHLCSAQALIVTAGTGCGKSTQIPQYIADDFYSYIEKDMPSQLPIRICCTQPRRVAAQELASRVATEYMTDLGELVGFKVGRRGHAKEDCVKIGKNTIIEFVTEGLLLFSLTKSAEFLEKYDAVIIDEMHERNKEQDLCLSLLRDYLRKLKRSRPSFKVVVMSASIDAERFCSYFDMCPKMNCPGRNYPVEEIYVPPQNSTEEEDVVSHAVRVFFGEVVHGAKDIPGDVLIFLSGAREIDACVSMISDRARRYEEDIAAYPLYSKLDQSSISAATNPCHRSGLNSTKKSKNQENIRKVICTTNIAETSLTINRVKFVIDSGRVKKVKYDHTLTCSSFEQAWVSKASSVQRKGRAGRTDNGYCYYMYGEEFHTNEMEPYDTPSILEEPVDMLILFSMNVCGRGIEDMGLLDSSKPEDVSTAREKLIDLEFLDQNWKLTNDGKIACSLSSIIRPESCRMVLNCFRNRRYRHVAKEVLVLAVVMSSTESIFAKDAMTHNKEVMADVRGDHMLALDCFEWFEAALNKLNKGNVKKRCLERGLDFHTLIAIQEDVASCHRELKKQKLFPSVASHQAVTSEVSKLECVLRSLISGYFFNVVDCIEPEYAKRLECKHLSSLSLYLDRNSFLNKMIGSTQNHHAVIEGASFDSDSDSGTDNLMVINKEVKPCFMLYGNLKKQASVNMTFMLNASTVDAQWILDEAPERWIQKVQFNSQRKNRCRIIIKHLGPKLLSKCNNHKDGFEELKSNCKVDSLVVNRERCLIAITGTQEAANKALQWSAFVTLIRHTISAHVCVWGPG